MSIRSNRPVTLTAATAVNRNVHDNKLLNLTNSAGIASTLPKATGSGARFKFNVATALASGAYTVTATQSGTFVGGVILNDTGDSTPLTSDYVVPAAADNTFSLAFSAGAGLAGDWVQFEDYAENKWLVSGAIQAGTDPTSPFSTT